MAMQDIMEIESDVYALFGTARSLLRVNDEGSEIIEALSLWDRGEIEAAKLIFDAVRKDEYSSFDERILARAGLVVYSLERNRVFSVKDALSTISKLLNEKCFVEFIQFETLEIREEASIEDLDSGIEIFKKMFPILEKLENSGNREVRRTASATRIISGYLLSKFYYNRNRWQEGVEELSRIEMHEIANKHFDMLSRIFLLKGEMYKCLEGKESRGAAEYSKKWGAVLSLMGIHWNDKNEKKREELIRSIFGS
ncbi:MAG: hypothetical protein WC788_05225 [Candidatus Paceibacterota bacterium]|jgi:hypothetical protein